jgi:hypothetical protein
LIVQSSSNAIDDAFVVGSGRVDTARHRSSLPAVHYGRPIVAVERRPALSSLSSFENDDASVGEVANSSPATVSRPCDVRRVAGIVGLRPGVRACVRTRFSTTFTCWWVFPFSFSFSPFFSYL